MVYKDHNRDMNTLSKVSEFRFRISGLSSMGRLGILAAINPKRGAKGFWLLARILDACSICLVKSCWIYVTW